MLSGKNKLQQADLINMLLQKVTAYKKQTITGKLREQKITRKVYRGKDFIINDSLLVSDEKLHTWQHYNNPDWIEFSFSVNGNVYQSQPSLFNDRLLSEGTQYFYSLLHRLRKIS